MTTRPPGRAAAGRVRPAALAVLLALAGLFLTVGLSDGSSLSGDSVRRDAVPSPGSLGDTGPPPLHTQAAPVGQPPISRDHARPTDDDGGRVGDGVTVFDDQTTAVSRLDPALLAALRRASTGASADGFVLRVNSGWRSAEHQHELLRQAVDEYGSIEAAARWVATPETSAHVSGDAVDIGPSAAARWLSRHGARYGLCQVYENEPWHYELRPAAADDGCPDMYPDPTHDPRMQQ